MPKNTALLKFTAPVPLIETLRSEASAANLSLGSYLITIINARPIKAIKPVKGPTQKEIKAANEAASDEKFRALCVEMLAQGVSHNSIKLYYAGLPAARRAKRDLILAEVANGHG